MNRPLGLYLHIPFCKGKCPYCDFYSVPFDDDLADAYVEALCRAMRAWPGDDIADTLYLGGGTPALLGPRRLERLLETARGCFGLRPDAEITLEANPGSLERSALVELTAAGFNRISLGVQSLNHEELVCLGRRHTADEALWAVEAAQKAGFSQVSADLMLGIPRQTPETLEASIRGLTGSGVCHVSAYLLKVEKGTPFFARGMEANCPDEDDTAALYLDACRLLREAGFERYEISNFAKDGQVALHNLKYWESEPYLGLGPAAHSFMGGRRVYFPRDLGAFIKAPDPMALAVDDGPGGGWEEYAMLRLRLAAGLNLGELCRRFGVETQPIAQRAEMLIAGGLVESGTGVLSLTDRGCLLSNAVTGRLLYG